MTTVYLPCVGFRQPGVRLVSPVIGELRGRTLTLRQLLATTDSTELIYDLTCLDDDIGFGPRQDAITVTIDGVEHRLERGGFSLHAQGSALRRHLRSSTLVPAKAGAVDVAIGIERLGEFRLAAQLTAFPEGRGSLRHEVEASTTRGGITLIVHAFAAAPDETAVDLEVLVEEKGMSCAGIGGLHGSRKGPTALSLRDDAGRSYAEHWHEPPALESRDVALFDPLPGDVRELELSVPYVFLEEEGRLELALPLTSPLTARLGRHTVRIFGTDTVPALPETGSFPYRGPGIGVDIDFGGWQDDRRVLMPGRVTVDGGGGGLRFGRAFKFDMRDPEPVDYFEVPASRPLDAKTMTLACPMVQVRGPWTVRFAIPSAPG